MSVVENASSQVIGLDWHRANASTDGSFVRDNTHHSCPLIVGEFERLMDRRDASPPLAGPLKPLFAYVAFHMVHMGDGNDSNGGSPLAVCQIHKCLEAPIEYVDRFSTNSSLTKGRRAFLGMVSLVDEAIGNITRRWVRIHRPPLPSGAL